jgi:hypothetical protein
MIQRLKQKKSRTYINESQRINIHGDEKRKEKDCKEKELISSNIKYANLDITTS